MVRTINRTNVNTDTNRVAVADDRRVTLIKIPKIKNSIISINITD